MYTEYQNMSRKDKKTEIYDWTTVLTARFTRLGLPVDLVGLLRFFPTFGQTIDRNRQVLDLYEEEALVRRFA
jgi:hypothetical protein